MNPLPLVDGAFFIDNSSLEQLTTCPRSMEYSRLFRRISAGAKPALNFGSALHLALEYRYRNCKNQPPDALEESEQGKLLSQFFLENPPPEDEFRNLNWAIEVNKKYNQTYQVEPFNVLVSEQDIINPLSKDIVIRRGDPLVELPFALKLFDYKSIAVYYSGRIDLPVMWDNLLTVIDHKTTSVMGDYFFKDQRVSPQQFGYVWAFEQITGMKVAQFCINAIRSKEQPAKPKGGMDAWWLENFQRHKEFVMPHHLEEWKANTIALIEEFFWHYERSFFPQKKKWCCGKFGLCPYYDVCDLPPSQRGLMLESAAFADNNWSPLKEPSQPLQ